MERTSRSEYRAALEAGGLWAAGVVLAILWFVFFAIGEISREAFLPFLVVLTWIAVMILGLHVAVARRRRNREMLGTS